MALPATFFLEPEAPADLVLPEGVDRAEYARLDQQVRDLVTEYRDASLGESWDGEHAFFRRYLVLALGSGSLLRAALSKTLQGSALRASRQLLEKEYAASEFERKFAVRQLQHSVDVYGVLIEQFGILLAEQPQRHSALLAAAQRFADSETELDRDEQTFLRFQLDLFASLTALDGPLEQLTRATTGARRIEATGNLFGAAALQAELKRLRAHNAWVGWTRQDAETELEPWPTRSSP